MLHYMYVVEMKLASVMVQVWHGHSFASACDVNYRLIGSLVTCV
jgi:hypothetical protein